MPTISAKRGDTQRRIAIVVFDGTKLLDVAGPLQVFTDARCPSGRPAYKISLLSETGGPVATDTVCQIVAKSFEDCQHMDWDTVLVSGGDSAYAAMESVVLQSFLKETASRCRRLGSICLGAFILAAGGYLTNRKATTHWDGCARLASQFSNVTVQDDSIFVEDEGIWTSAGVTAGIDMALEMVKRDLGAAEALRLAKSLVLPMLRSGGQRQFSATLASQAASQSGRFAELVGYVSANPAERHTVAAMAARVAMSERNFSRRFAMDVGVSPACFVERVRVEFAANLLHRKDISLSTARAHAGFSSDENMRRAFNRQLSVSPSAYAAKFTSDVV